MGRGTSGSQNAIATDAHPLHRARNRGQGSVAIPKSSASLRSKPALSNFARQFGMRPDWHEPDEQGISVQFAGSEVSGPDALLIEFLHENNEKPVGSLAVTDALNWATQKAIPGIIRKDYMYNNFVTAGEADKLRSLLEETGKDDFAQVEGLEMRFDGQGRHFDNAMGVHTFGEDTDGRRLREPVVELSRNGQPWLVVNLANLCAWASS